MNIRGNNIKTLVSARLREILHSWRDPEFWGLKGLGCSHCHDRPPIIQGLAFGALCDVCLERSLPGWSFERIVEWLGSQRGIVIRRTERTEAVKAARKYNLRPALEYERKYGVWPLEYPHP